MSMHSSMANKQTFRTGREIDLGDYGGAELFFADINGDREPEIIAYQGPAVFGARMFRALPHVRDLFPAKECVSAFNLEGKKLWTWGKTNPPGRPYISHAYESVISIGNIEGNGRPEVAVACGDHIVILGGRTGKEKRSCSLPEDYFYQVQILGESTGADEAALVVKNGEFGSLKGFDGKPYPAGWDYGQPAIGLNMKLEPVWGPLAVPGAGHHVLCLDMDGDGRKDYRLGYAALNAGGRTIWRMDDIDHDKVKAFEQHVDYTDTRLDDKGRMILALAGSDKAYLADQSGKTIMAREDLHVQGAAIGRFLGGDTLQAAFYNAPNGPIALYDMAGEPVGRMAVERNWPFKIPDICRTGRFHRNRPIITLPGTHQDWIAYADGGWPRGMDGSGDFSLVFEPPEDPCLPALGDIEIDCKAVRLDDIGFGFALKMISFQGKNCAVIYNRRRAWLYSIP